ncbi:MAG TPA: glutamate racemase [Thermoleophilaceae bacterium]|nr:glutamate racemase [Thermoleophilaceae bacterium]
MGAPDRHGPVALFDSGVGGLTVLHECLVQIPHENFLYLGDTARFPYGDRSLDQLREFAHELAAILVNEGAKMLVVACNSATSASMPGLRKDLEGVVDVISVVEPESRLAANTTRNRRIGLLATPATVDSGAYQRALRKSAPGCEVTAVGTRELAPLIQREGDWWDQQLVDCIDRVCGPLVEAKVDTVILGCTHYPLVRPMLQRRLGRRVRLVSSGEAIAEAVHDALRADGLDRDDEHRRGDYSFMCTGDPGAFHRTGGRFLQMPLGQVRQVEVRGPHEVHA